MPYLDCPHCRLTVYSAARYTSVDECPRCSTPLALEPRPLFSQLGAITTPGEPRRISDEFEGA
jgi:hypothetical protein